MAEIPDLIFTVDENGNVVYPNSGGGYSTGNGSTTGGYSNPTGKKWWETFIGALPGILSGIFGGNQSQAQTNNPYPTTNAGSSGLGSMNMMLIVVAVGLVVFLLLKKK